MKSLPILHRDFTTSAGVDLPLTGSYVYSTGRDIQGLAHHNIDFQYDPDEADGKLSAIVQGSMDGPEVTDANSKWTTLGSFSRAAGVITFTADTLEKGSGGAGTIIPMNITYTDQPYMKLRVGVKETFTAGGSNLGNVRVISISWAD